MVIQEVDFRLIPIDTHHLSFDLELLQTINSKKGERKEFKNAAYGVTLEYAIKMVAQYRVHRGHKDEAITLKTYFNEYKTELDSLTELLKL